MTNRKTITENDMKKIVKVIKRQYNVLEKERPESYVVRDIEYKIYANDTQATVNLTAQHFGTSCIRSMLYDLDHLEIFDVSMHWTSTKIHASIVFVLKR